MMQTIASMAVAMTMVSMASADQSPIISARGKKGKKAPLFSDFWPSSEHVPLDQPELRNGLPALNAFESFGPLFVLLLCLRRMFMRLPAA
jgi:hypothetical protein